MAQILEVAPARDQSAYKQAARLLAAGELDRAYAVLDEILRRDPDDAQALCGAAEILKKAKKLPIAYQLARRASELRPERAEAWGIRGHAAQELWRMTEATACYKKALQRSHTPQKRALYIGNTASVQLDMGHFEAAEEPARAALALDPDDPTLRHNLGLSLLGQRRWREGWQYYSASVGTARRLNVKYRDEPTWDGSPGQTVVIYGEQGLGDEICAASMVPDAIRDCRRVILDCDHRLAKLFRRSFPAATVHGTRWEKQLAWPPEDQALDASIAAFEVAKFYRNEADAFPGAPYLTPCPTRTAAWRGLFRDRPTIGIAWTGGTWQNAALYRSLPLPEWAPIFQALDARWVCLQYKDAAAELAGSPVEQYPWATLTADYDDTAAFVAACDAVVAVQTSVVHLAGALGVPCLSLIPATSQWRYGESFTDLPWYRSVTLARPARGRPFATCIPQAIEWLQAHVDHR